MSEDTSFVVGCAVCALFIPVESAVTLYASWSLHGKFLEAGNNVCQVCFSRIQEDYLASVSIGEVLESQGISRVPSRFSPPGTPVLGVE